MTGAVAHISPKANDIANLILPQQTGAKNATSPFDELLSEATGNAQSQDQSSANNPGATPERPAASDGAQDSNALDLTSTAEDLADAESTSDVASLLPSIMDRFAALRVRASAAYAEAAALQNLDDGQDATDPATSTDVNDALAQAVLANAVPMSLQEAIAQRPPEAEAGVAALVSPTADDLIANAANAASEGAQPPPPDTAADDDTSATPDAADAQATPAQMAQGAPSQTTALPDALSTALANPIATQTAAAQNESNTTSSNDTGKPAAIGSRSTAQPNAKPAPDRTATSPAASASQTSAAAEAIVKPEAALAKVQSLHPTTAHGGANPQGQGTEAAPQLTAAPSAQTSLTAAPDAAAAVPGAIATTASNGSVRVELKLAPASDTATGLDALALRIATKWANGDSNFNVRLDPPELGGIEVSLRVNALGEAHANLTADKQQTLDLLQRDSGVLERALKDAGLDLAGGLSFSLKSDGEPRSWRNTSDHNRGKAMQLAVTESGSAPHAAIIAGSWGGQMRLDIRV